MVAKFHGEVTLRGGTSEMPPPGDLASKRFDGGWIAYAAGVDVRERDGVVCVACGEPRFGDARLDALARERGAATAWIDAFAASGERAPAQVRGRFSAVLVRPADRSVVIVTDRFATWPICAAATDTGIRFGARADDVAGADSAISPQAVFDYLYFHVIPAPSTIFANVVRIPAGVAATWSGGRLEYVPYFTPIFDEDRRPSLVDAKRTFVDLVRASVEREVGNGEGIGAFLSGGTDSSTVAGMLCRVLGQPAPTYSIGFDAAGYDEMEYARIAARHFGTRHHEHYVTPDELLEGIPAVAAHYDQPFGNSSAVPAWICARLARADGILKMLAGDGGDELFGGNVRYAKQRVFSWYERVPAALRSAVLEPLIGDGPLGRIWPLTKGASYIVQARTPMPDRLEMYNMLARIGIPNIFEPAFIDAIDAERPLRAQRERWHEARARALINGMLAYDWKYTLADNDLVKVLGTTELAGVDVGFPLLSDELLEFSTSLPPEWKLKGLTLRWFFKEALRDFLPEAIIKKKKHGFGLPFGHWALEHAGLKTLVHDALHAFEKRGVVQPAFVRELLSRLLPEYPGYYGEMAFILTVLELWLERHRPDWRFA